VKQSVACSSRGLRRTVLSRALLLAFGSLSLPAFASDECGAAPKGGQVVCTPTGAAIPQVRYEGVTDLEVLLKQGFSVDGNMLPDGDTAVVVYGEGAITLTAEDGTRIHAHDGWPAIDVVSSSGPVNVRVDQVVGGNVGIAALAAGDVTVWANVVEGTTAIEATSLGGNVTVDVAAVFAGATGAGVAAMTAQGNVHIMAGEAIAQGDFSTGLFASTADGSTLIEAGFVSAEGIGAAGIWAESQQNGDVVVDVQTVTSTGEGGAGILAGAGLGDVYVKSGWTSAAGAYGVGIGVFAFLGNVVADLGGVGTDGDATRGVDIGALGTVDVRVDSIFTMGAGAHAMNVETTGDIAIQARQLTTYGADSYALSVLTGSDVMLGLEEVSTYGERAAALYASTDTGDVMARVGRVHTWATTGDWFAVGLNSNSGDVALLVEESVRAESGYAITTGALFGGATIGVAEGANVFGQAIAIDSATALGTRVDIAGTVESGTGPVINIAGNDFGDGAADIRIASTGAVRGFLQLSGGDDVVTNAGDFASSGINAFGEGDDRFANAGTVRLQDGATSMAFEGLDRFDNAGRVSLVNGTTGDVFALDGTLHGAGGTLAVDLDVVDGSADVIEVGALSGTSAIELDLVGRGSLLGLDGIRVLSSDGAQTGQELVLAENSRNRGFVGFRLAYDGLDSWRLETDLADQAYLAAAVPAGVRDLWRQGVQSVSTHLVATHDDVDANGVWMQAMGGDFDGTSNLSHALGSRELEWQGDSEGVQMGAEMTAGQWRAGITGGYGKAQMDLGGIESTELDSLNLGLYAQWSNDGWFANGVLRADRIDMDTNWQTIGLDDQGDGSAVGLDLEGGHRFALARMWIEPYVRTAWVDVSLPDQAGNAGDIHWDDSGMATGELGLRLGVADGWHGVRPYASMALAREFGGGDETVYDIGFDVVRVSDEGDRSFGRFAGGVEWSIGRVDLYGEVEARTGDMDGTSGRLGARVRF
jgi:hypothetical protein